MRPRAPCNPCKAVKRASARVRARFHPQTQAERHQFRTALSRLAPVGRALSPEAELGRRSTRTGHAHCFVRTMLAAGLRKPASRPPMKVGDMHE